MYMPKPVRLEPVLVFHLPAYIVQNRSKGILLIFFIILFCFLLVFPGESLSASKEGLLLWYDSLLPALLPFLILSQLLLKTSFADKITKAIGPLFCRLFHCSANGAFCALCGFLCGYPVGARLIALQLKEKKLTLKEGQHLLSFCNNVSPMFCISYGITKAIGSTRIFPYLFVIYGAPLLFGFLTRPAAMSKPTVFTQKQTSPSGKIFRLIDVCIIDSFEILIKLCGYLVLFSIIAHCIGMFLPQSMPYALPAVTAVLEITNGLALISRLSSGTLRSAFAVAALSFGGLCCIFQTDSVIAGSGLSLKKYLLHKMLTAVLSLFLYFLLRLLLHFSINGWC